MTALGGFGHVGEERLVEVGLCVEGLSVFVVIEHVAFAAHANGVESDAEFRCQLGGGFGVDRAFVVDSIGEQYDHFANGLAVFDSVDGCGQSVANGGAVFYKSGSHRC